MRYRSGFEKKFAKWLTENKIKFEYEKNKLLYRHKIFQGQCGHCNSKDVYVNKDYLPDFVLKNGIFLELKGKFTSQMRTKMKEVFDANPGIDLRMVFMYDNWLTKKHTMRYSDWCKKNGIKYHVVKDKHKPTIPKTWTR